MPRHIRVVALDLFCGCGGATQGLLNAGAEVVGSFDGWTVAETLHKHNFPDVPFELRWLGKDPADDLRRMVEILAPHRAQGAHIHVHGSPPCQAFSAAGGARANTTLEQGLSNVKHYLWLVEELKALDLCDSWSMENVIQVRAHFPDLPHQVLWSHEFGVPQKRKRWFAGEGWLAKPTVQGAAWNEVIGDRTLPKDALLNTIGAGKSASKRLCACDIPQGEPARTLCRQRASIRTPNEDGTFTKIRQLTFKEQVLLHGFPASFTKPAGMTQTDAGIAIGNVVSPPVMAAVVRGLL